MKYSLIAFIVFIFGAKAQSLEGKYLVTWKEGNEEYTLKINKTFIYANYGHPNGKNTSGKYIMIGDTIKLIYNKQKNEKQSLKEKFLVDGDSCIINLETKFDYCIMKSGNYREPRRRKKN